MRVAVIGAGPSGFFVAGEFLKRCPGGEVRLFEKRVAPYGLVRYGVAPDHQLTRRTIKMFDQIADHSGFRYCGNVEVGADVSLADLRGSFHAVVVCTGAELPNRPELPGARLPGTADALDLARWANGEGNALPVDWLNGVASVLIIGNGNVALDAARILARPSVDWPATDIAPPAMEALMHHRIHEIIIAGRRGPEETSFTEAELEALLALPGWAVHAACDLPFGLKPARLISDRVITFQFNLRATELLGRDRVTGARFVRSASGEATEISAPRVIFATGHRGIKFEGLPFDETRGIIPNDQGAVTGAPGMYVCGWIKRGAKGLIGQNRKDAIETVSRLMEDAPALSSRPAEGKDWVAESARRGKRVVTWDDWKKINALEAQRGSAIGRPRLNFSAAEALAFLDGQIRTAAKERPRVN